MDVRDDVATSDGALDEGVELLVPAVGKMLVPRGETLRLEVPSSIAGHLEDLGSEVLEDGGRVDDGTSTDTSMHGGCGPSRTANTKYQLESKTHPKSSPHRHQPNVAPRPP